MASTYLIRSTPSETFSKLTVSCWFKGMADGTQRNFWGLYDNSDNTRFFGLYYSSNGSLYAYWKQGGEGVQFSLGTTQKFRDPSAWYHFVMTMDTTLATASDRVKFYVNGERVTSFEDSLDTITQSKTCNMMNGTTDGRMQWGGGKISGTQYYWNGLMSHCHMCVGYAYDASSFGSTDSTTGEWKINTSPSVSYGTNGGWWLKDGSQLTDSSSNSNTLTVGGGTLTNTEDCPSNVFATLNPLHKGNTLTGFTFANGNNTITFGSTSYPYTFSTQALSTGKWYAEFKVTANPNDVTIGISNGEKSTYLSHSQYDYAYVGSNGNVQSNQSGSSYGSALSTNDILGVAMDLDNNKLYFSKNGTFQNSGVPTSGSTGTGAYSITAPSSTTNGVYHFAVGDFNSAASSVQCNFGNGYFGTTAISSEGSNASGIGKFEYDVPTGYTALSTKGLNE
jgi:hypothetical protein